VNGFLFSCHCKRPPLINLFYHRRPFMSLIYRKTFILSFFNIVLMLMLVLITAYPFYYVVIASFSDPLKLAAHSGILLKPLEPYDFNAYKDVLGHPLLISGFRNTIFIVVIGTTLNLLFTALGAFFLSQSGPMFKGAVAVMIIISMYFYGGMIPSYMLIKNLGLMNSHFALILPVMIDATYMIILKTAFQSVPVSLTESALLDGASYFKILFKIMIPLSKATIAVLALYYALDYWNAWFNASIYLRDQELYPIQLAVKNLLETDTISQPDYVTARHSQLIKYALIVVISTPVIMIYPFIQKYFTKGVMMGSVKS